MSISAIINIGILFIIIVIDFTVIIFHLRRFYEHYNHKCSTQMNYLDYCMRIEIAKQWIIEFNFNNISSCFYNQITCILFCIYVGEYESSFNSLSAN